VWTHKIGASPHLTGCRTVVISGVSVFRKTTTRDPVKSATDVEPSLTSHRSDTGRLKEGSKAGEGDDSMIGAIGMMG